MVAAHPLPFAPSLRPLPSPPPCTIDASSRELSAESHHQWTARSRSHPASHSSASPPLQVRAYREATRLVPTDRASLLNLGELLQWLGRTDAANVTYALAVTRGIWAHPQQRPGHYVPRLEARPWLGLGLG